MKINALPPSSPVDGEMRHFSSREMQQKHNFLGGTQNNFQLIATWHFISACSCNVCVLHTAE